jgi:hypothetical protein
MKKNLIFFLFIIITLTSLSAQNQPTYASDDLAKSSINEADAAKNFIKLNLTSALVKNYSLQYERVLSKSISAALSFKMMPESGLPFPDNIISMAKIDDPKAKDAIRNLVVSDFTVTPEIRFYTGKKKYGRGFYFSLFYRYGRFEMDDADVTFEGDLEEDIELNLSGNVTSHTGGFMIGTQWALGEHMCLDWWILGPHFGVSSGDVIGLSSVPLTEEEQQDVEDELNDIDIPMFNQTVNVTADKATMDFTGPWGGLRTGLSLGIRF